MKKILPALMIITPLALSACSTLDEDVARFETLSCYELAQEIGKWQYKLDRAEEEGEAAVWDDILADNEKEEDAASAKSLVADLTEDEAKEYLTELRRIESQKRCR